jgi:drug/metabolite transporter (DMT)-like permease
MRQPAPRTITWLIALLCLLWGSTWIVIRKGLDDLPPFTSAGVRFLLIALSFSWMFAERVTWNTILGAALIIGGVIAVVRGKVCAPPRGA